MMLPYITIGFAEAGQGKNDQGTWENEKEGGIEFTVCNHLFILALFIKRLILRKKVMCSTCTKQKGFSLSMKAGSILNNHKRSSAPPFRRMVCRNTPLVVILLAVALSLPLGVLGTPGLSLAQTDATDPAADYQMWRDDEIFMPLWVGNNFESTSYEYDPNDGTLSPPLSYCNPLETPWYNLQVDAAAGRVMSPYSDQVIMAYAASEGNNLDLRFADRCDQVTHSDIGPWVQLGPAIGMPGFGADTKDLGYYDITIGDLDRQTDVNLSYRDEVVVAYAGTTANPDIFTLTVAVVDYTKLTSGYWPEAPTVTWMNVEGATVNRSIVQTNQYGVMPLAVTTGDFDGDTHKEIAVAYLKSSLTLGVAVFSYTTHENEDGTVTHSLDLVQSIESSADQWSGWSPEAMPGSIDAVAGDLDGNGKDELSVGAIVQGISLFSDAGLSGASVNLKTFRFNSALLMTEVAPNTPATIPFRQELGNSTRVRLATGLFKFVPDSDPLKDFGLSRRQLAVALQDDFGDVNVHTLVYDSNLWPTFNPGQLIRAAAPLNFWIAGGGFKGVRSSASADDVVWSLAISTWNQTGRTLSLLDRDPSTGAFRSPFLTETLSTIGNMLTPRTSAPLVAYDHGQPTLIAESTTVLAGDSMYLGAPLYMVLEGAYTFDYILQEPPKHVYWDPELKTIVNISGKDAFTVGTTDKQEIGVTNSSKDNTDKSWGVSESASGTISFAGGLIRPPKAEATLSETVGYDYKEHDATYDKDMEQRTVALSHNADRDDAIRYRIQNIDVWRYCVYGANFEDLDENPMVGFMDITRPGTIEELITSGTTEIDVYQPVHENNNILSYPSPTGGEYNPTDMGSFQVQCTDVDCFEPNYDEEMCECDKDPDTGLLIQTIYEPLVDKVTWTYGGTSGTQEWSDTRTSTEGKERSTSKTLTANEDIKGTMRLNFPEARIKVSGTLDIAAHESWSWSDSSTMETTTSELTSIKLSIPTGNSSESYHFYPVFYVATDGTMKVTFAVDPMTDNSESFWKGLYGGQPDPALNLPNRFNATTEALKTVWYPNTGDNRKLIRGFFVRQWEADEVTGEYTEYAGPPNAGDVVRLECRVYNYSTGQSVTNLKVRFEYIEIDQASGHEIGTRTPIIDVQMPNDTGTGNDYTIIPSLAPRGMAKAAVNWQIPSFSDKASKDYRIYVVLDPDNGIKNEKYETESTETRTYCPDYADCTNPANYIDPGQNNEGWRKVTVLASLPTATDFERPADVHLKSDALAAINPRGKLVTTTVQAYERQPLKIRVRIDTDYPGAESAHLLLFDGDPYDGKLIANRLAFTGDPDGSYVWIEWVPTELGPHRLYARVMESTLDTNLGNNISDELKVVVIKAPQGPKKTPKGLTKASKESTKAPKGSKK